MDSYSSNSDNEEQNVEIAPPGLLNDVNLDLEIAPPGLINGVDFDPEDLSWERRVTAQMLNRVDTLHLPRFIGRLIRRDERTVLLIDSERQVPYVCKLHTDVRDNKHKYLIDGWNECFRDLNCNVGQKLLFWVEDRPLRIYVEFLN